MVLEVPNVTGDAATVLTAKGAFAFRDLDPADVHSLTIAPKAGGYLGSLAAAVTSESASGSLGRIDWTFTTTDKSLDALAAGQKVTQVYTLAVSDGAGGIIRQDVAVTITGAEDKPVITGSLAGATIFESSAASFTRSGTLSFSDVDATDLLTTSILGQTVKVQNSAGQDITASFAAEKFEALKQAFSMPVGALGGSKGSQTWTYAIADSPLDFLGSNETATIVTTVKVVDNQGGSSTADVVITLRGANDAPVTVTGSVVSGGITEAANTVGGIALQSSQGSIQFTDLDLTDKHSVSVTPKQAGYLGTLSPVLTTDTAGGGTGVVTWTYSVQDRVLDALGPGQQLVQTYTVNVSDGRGGVLKQDVVIVLTGSEDAPTISGPTSVQFVEGSAPTFVRTGTITVADPDANAQLLASLSQSLVAKSATGADITSTLTSAQVAALTQAFTVPQGNLGVNKASLGWSFSLADSALDFLGLNETVTLTNAVSVDDRAGGVAATTVVMTLKGVNDAPIIDQTSSFTATLADTAARSSGINMQAGGSFAFYDIDQRDAHTVASAASQTGYVGTFSARLVQDSTGAQPGSVAWTYTVADKIVDALGAGQTLKQTYVVSVNDGKGGVAKQNVDVVLTGSNDLPVITGLVGSTVYELPPSASESMIHRGGTLKLADVDQTDHLEVSFTPASVSFTDAAGRSISDLPSQQLTADQASALSLAKSLAANLSMSTSTAGNQGSVNWSFDAAASKLAFLEKGETVKITVNVVVQDLDAANGPTGEAVVKPVTITLVGQDASWQAKDHTAELMNKTILTSPTSNGDIGCQLPAAALRSYLDLGGNDGTTFLRPVTVRIDKDGATLDGIDFRGSQVVVAASNVSFVNCLFDSSGSLGRPGVDIGAGIHDISLDHCSFDGLKRATGYPDFISSAAERTTITNSVFLNAPSDGIYIESGIIANNYFKGGGYYPGTHADAIWIGKTTGPVLIENNAFDWRAEPGALTNNVVRISGERGDVSDVMIRNNAMIGGNYSITVTDGATWTHTADQVGSVTGVSIIDNIIDVAGTGPIDWQNRPADTIIAGNLNLNGFVAFGALSSTPSLNFGSLSAVLGTTGADTLQGSDVANYLVGGEGQDVIYAGAHGSVIQGGAGRDFLFGSSGADTFVYRAGREMNDLIRQFDVSMDKIDVADVVEFRALGLTSQSWNWLGGAVFTGDKYQVRFVQGASQSSLQFDVNGDTFADYKIDFVGSIPFSRDNLVLEHTADAATQFNGLWAGQGVDLVSRSLTTSASFSDSHLVIVGRDVALRDADGALAPVTGLNSFAFADGSITRADADPLVDDLFYFLRNPVRWGASTAHDAEADFYGTGWTLGLDPNAYFSTKGYMATFGAAAGQGVDPLSFYASTGWKLGQDPSASFDTSLYLLHNRDAAASGLDPLTHFLTVGAAAGRKAYAVVGDVGATGFDAEFYVLAHPEAAADPYAHYLTSGWKSGFNPNAYFDVNFYLAQNPAVAAAGVDPLQHYMTAGWRQGLNPSADFDAASYLAANPDVAQAGLNPLLHFLQTGADEGRDAFASGAGWQGGAPIGVADSFAVSAVPGTDLMVAGVNGVLANDVDPNGDALIVKAVSQTGLLSGQVTQGLYGKLFMGFDGGFRYTVTDPVGPQGAHLTERFTYVVGDNTGANNAAVLDIVLNRAPTAAVIANSLQSAASLSVAADKGVLAKVTDADADALTVASVMVNGVTVLAGQAIQGQYGTLTVQSDGAYSYTALPSYVGKSVVDAFSLVVSDSFGATSTSQLQLDLKGTQTAPVIMGGGGAFTVTENAPGSYMPGGQFTVSDADLNDQLTVSVAKQTFAAINGKGADTTSLFSDAQINAIKNAFVIKNGQVGGPSGLVDWSFAGSDSILDVLGSNETATLTSSVQVDDGRGGLAARDIVLTLKGVNDSPLFTATGGATATFTELADRTRDESYQVVQGAVAFKDADAGDQHTLTVAPAKSGYFGALTASITFDTVSGGQGLVMWSFTALERTLDALAYGQTLQQTYTLTLADGKGGVAKQDVVVTIVGGNDLPTIAGAASATWFEGGAASYLKSGALTFADVDATDKLVVSVTKQTVVLKNAAGIDVSGLMSADQITALKQAFAIPVDELGSNKGTATWTYAINDKAVDFLGQNDSVTVTSTVQVDDHNGGVATRDVVITMKGVNDAPMFTPAPVNDARLDGKVAQGANVDLASVGGALVHHETGSLSFTDADLTDAHGVTVKAAAVGYLGAFKAVITDGPGGGIVDWSFDIDDATLAKFTGDRVQTYSVTVGDGKGGSAKQDISIALTHESADQFTFPTTPTTPKIVDSFIGGWDSLKVSSAAVGLSSGALTPDRFQTGSAETAGDKMFVLDTKTNNLVWSSFDATGQHILTTYAHFGYVSDLHASDIIIV
ncbi:hypothetical protein GCM10007036_18540 [Alsobacter metallidurans]|uniref:RapA2 cadherin-like domain-containing protein n=1 Tax=Alsobacter metallidurans TaxID=340221 RepID=A0A917I6E4_9HYPH|nr:VCBS domain-containing protein [Alsobacter metallidurans]GGH17251.1 hypothetical protein GCM10007036_18540 [Alsobacter metallidurans]